MKSYGTKMFDDILRFAIEYNLKFNIFREPNMVPILSCVVYQNLSKSNL